jgi:hypothetical protein
LQVLFPVAVVLLSYIWIVYGVMTLVYGVVFWFVTGICMTGAAYQQRPSMRTGDKVVQMLLAVLYPVWGMFLLRFAGWKAILTLRDQSWGTRGADAPEPEVVRPAIVAVTGSDEDAKVIGIRSRREIA